MSKAKDLAYWVKRAEKAEARIARMQREPAYREDAFELVERELLATGADYFELRQVKPADRSWGNGGPLKRGALIKKADMLKERGRG